MCWLTRYLKRLLVNSRLPLNSLSLITNTWRQGGIRKMLHQRMAFLPLGECWTTSAKAARQALTNKVQDRVPMGTNYLLPSPSFVLCWHPAEKKGSVVECIIGSQFFLLFPSLCYTSWGRLCFSVPLTLSLAIRLALAKGKWAEVLMNEFGSRMLKGTANFCQTFLALPLSPLRRACPRKLRISEWDTCGTGLALIHSLKQSCHNWPLDTWWEQ